MLSGVNTFLTGCRPQSKLKDECSILSQDQALFLQVRCRSTEILNDILNFQVICS